MDAQIGLAFDRDRAAQAVQRQPFRQIARGIALAIDQDVVAIAPDQEIEQRLALRGQQRRPDRQVARRVVGDQPLQETADIVARQADQGAVDEGGIGHARQSRERGSQNQALHFCRGRPRMTDRLTIRRPDDWHVHLRDGAMLTHVARYTARQFARAIVMPNLSPPVTTAEEGRAYRDRINAAVPADLDFTPLIVAYLTDATDPDEIARGHAEGVFTAAKLYPAHATTGSAHGVTDVANIMARARTDAGRSACRC